MLSREALMDRLEYDELTGQFAYKRTVGGRGQKGSLAGSIGSRGYVAIIIDGCRFRAHRLAWLYVHGEWPGDQIDHIDGNRANNAIANLRLCNQSQNNANTKKRVTNTSGFKGVSWHRRYRKWTASIKLSGKQTHLGYFTDKEVAAAAYASALVKNFGEFARLN
jgi:hypothetical protein